MSYRDMFDAGRLDPNRDKTIDKRRKILSEFIGCPVEEITFDDGCYDNDLYRYKGRFYHCASLENHLYGDPWYPKNQWADIKGHRCSVEYHLVRSEQNHSWTLYIGNVETFVWRNKTTQYKPKTAKQIRRLARDYVREMRKKCDGDYDEKVVFSMIEQHFWMLFGRWFDGRNCKLETNMEGLR